VPEGDTVWLTAHRLHGALAVQRLVRAELRVSAYATSTLAGATVTEVVSYGKHLLTRLDDGRTVHTHLRMDGSWRLFAHGKPWRGGATHQIRALLCTEQTDAVGYRVHDIAVAPTADESRWIGHLGPDLLGTAWDADPATAHTEALRRLREKPTRDIGSALLDQRNLAGIGTLYRAETLFLTGTNPWTPVTDVPDLGAVVGKARRLLRANRDHWDQSTTGSTRRGQEHWVFERQRRPCRRCRTPIEVAKTGEPPYQRLAYWCPHCQPTRDKS